MYGLSSARPCLRAGSRSDPRRLGWESLTWRDLVNAPGGAPAH